MGCTCKNRHIKVPELILKAGKKEPEWRILHRIADKIAPITQGNLVKGVKAFRKKIDLNAIIREIRAGRYHNIESMLPWHELPNDLKILERTTAQGIEESGKATQKFFNRSVAKLIPDLPADARVSFSLENPRIQAIINRNIGLLMHQISETTKEGIRHVIAQGIQNNRTATDMAKQIKNVGLTSRQLTAVDNFERKTAERLAESGLSNNQVVEQTSRLTERYEARQLKSRMRGIARTESMRVVNIGQQELWEQASDQGLFNKDEAKKVWITTDDDLLCDFCAPMNGVTVGINEMFQTDLVSLLEPPLHPNCFDDKTEVLTCDGWKFFKDVRKDKHKILSVDLETQDAEWVGVKEEISYFLEDGLLNSFKNKIVNVVSTTDHNHVFKSRHGKDWQLIPISEFKSEGSLLGTIPNWSGKKKSKVIIGSKEFNLELFLKFLAFYISEGNISKPKSGSYQIKISQEKNYEAMALVIGKLFDKVWYGKDAIYIPLYDEDLIKFFKQFGYSYQKFIPDFIKELDRESLQIFLDAYLLGDGSIVPGKIWDGYQCKPSRIYRTSSDKLASDIGELILKIGKRPSYKKTNFGWIKHRNGTYLTKHNIWIISENSIVTPNTNNIRMNLIPYTGYVYCLELEKFHTLFVRREGKTILSGNCRCVVALEFK